MERLLTTCALASAALLASCTAPQDIRVVNDTGAAVTLSVLSTKGERSYGPLEAGGARTFHLKERLYEVREVRYAYGDRSCSISREEAERRVYRGEHFHWILRLPAC